MSEQEPEGASIINQEQARAEQADADKKAHDEAVEKAKSEGGSGASEAKSGKKPAKNDPPPPEREGGSGEGDQK